MELLSVKKKSILFMFSYKLMQLIYPQKNAVDLVPPITKVHNLIFGRTWVDSPGEMVMTNLTTLITR